jgi:hypothetical protein
VAAALALHERGHDIAFFGDEALVEAVGERLPAIESDARGRDLSSYLQEWRHDQSIPRPISFTPHPVSVHNPTWGSHTSLVRREPMLRLPECV